MTSFSGPTTLLFGDRLGTSVALLFFGVLCAILGFGVWRGMRRRMPEHPRTASTIGTMLFAGPLVLIYISSLDGFYEADIRDRELLLRYLHRPEISIALTDIEAIRVAPAFKGRWRLHVRRTGNRGYESAAGNREQINNAAEHLRLAMPKLR